MARSPEPNTNNEDGSGTGGVGTGVRSKSTLAAFPALVGVTNDDVITDPVTSALLLPRNACTAGGNVTNRAINDRSVVVALLTTLKLVMLPARFCPTSTPVPSMLIAPELLKLSPKGTVTLYGPLSLNRLMPLVA
jgi:hypothetical protein